MHQPNIHQARESLADYLAAAQRGEDVLICRRNRPIARLVAVPQRSTTRRLIGGAPDAGQALAAAFWEPLPDVVVASMGGSVPHDLDPLGAPTVAASPPRLGRPRPAASK